MAVFVDVSDRRAAEKNARLEQARKMVEEKRRLAAEEKKRSEGSNG